MTPTIGTEPWGWGHTEQLTIEDCHTKALAPLPLGVKDAASWHFPEFPGHRVLLTHPLSYFHAHLQNSTPSNPGLGVCF